jgi:hypothetical protein
MNGKNSFQRRPYKSPAAAGILSGFFPGAGALYNGEYMKGVLFIIIFAGLVTMQTHGRGQPFLGILLGGFYFFQLIEAIQSAKNINRLALQENGADKAPSASGAPAPAAAKPASSGSVFWGIVLMALGAIFLLANFEIIDYDRIFDFWPVIVIVIGLKMIADYFSKKNA